MGAICDDSSPKKRESEYTVMVAYLKKGVKFWNRPTDSPRRHPTARQASKQVLEPTRNVPM